MPEEYSEVRLSDECRKCHTKRSVVAIPGFMVTFTIGETSFTPQSAADCRDPDCPDCKAWKWRTVAQFGQYVDLPGQGR